MRVKERNKERACARERDRSRERENRERQRETESEPDVRMARKWEERARFQSTWLFYGALCSQKATSFSEMIYRSCYTRTHAEKGTDVETEITPKGILLCADGISRELRSTAHLLRDGVRCAPFRLRHLLALVHASSQKSQYLQEKHFIHRYHFRSHSRGH